MPDRISEHILHVDMDAFFVEVERTRDPDLRGRPVIVGGLGPRGVVAAASYEARRDGVHSAMPMVEARRRCPRAVYLPPDHRAYGAMSRRVFDVLRSFTPLVEGLSVDEAFLEIGGLRLHYESAAAVGAAIRDRIRSELGLPASVGGATSKFVAKLASEEAKPDGILIVAEREELAFLHPLPVARLWGVGQATLARLEALGIATIGDVAAAPENLLQRRLGASLGRHLAALARGDDDRPVEPGGGAKSVSVEETYPSDLRAASVIERELLRLCDRLAGRLRRSGLAGRTVHLKVRFGDFTTVTRSDTVEVALAHTQDLWEVAHRLLAKVERAGRGVRLLGVGVSSLEDHAGPRQLSLEHPRRDAAASAAEAVRARFGDAAVIPATLVERPVPRAEPADDPPET